jgi:hypothetical protein
MRDAESSQHLNNSFKMDYPLTVQKRKDAKIVIAFALAALITSTACTVVFQNMLQSAFADVTGYASSFFPSFALPIDAQWTDNVGVDFNYINCSGTVWNLGLKEARNVALVISIWDVNDVLLKRERILIGNVGALQDKAFYVNVYYSGELANVNIATTWN